MPAAQTLHTSFSNASPADESGTMDNEGSGMGGLLGSRAFWVGGLVSALAWAALTVLLLG